MPAAAWPGCPLVSAALVRGARWQLLLLIVGLGLFGLLIYAAGPAGVFRTFRHLGWLTPLVVLPYLASYVLDTLGWWWVLSRIFVGPADAPLPMPSFGQLFALRAAGEAVNAITPAA